MKKKPIQEFRRGLVVVRVWRKQARRDGKFSTSILRLYRNGNSWKESTRFDPEDLPLIRLALDDAFEWLLVRKEANRSES